MSLSKRNKSLILLKIDIEKAFDKVSWSSILMVRIELRWAFHFLSDRLDFGLYLFPLVLLSGQWRTVEVVLSRCASGRPHLPLPFHLGDAGFFCPDARRRISPYKCKNFIFSHASLCP